MPIPLQDFCSKADQRFSELPVFYLFNDLIGQPKKKDYGKDQNTHENLVQKTYIQIKDNKKEHSHKHKR
jgi:hypothetical protein